MARGEGFDPVGTLGAGISAQKWPCGGAKSDPKMRGFRWFVGLGRLQTCTACTTIMVMSNDQEPPELD